MELSEAFSDRGSKRQAETEGDGAERRKMAICTVRVLCPLSDETPRLEVNILCHSSHEKSQYVSINIMPFQI